MKIQRDSRLPIDTIPLSAFLESYLGERGDKKGKTIPDWIFDMSDDNVRGLDEVKMFGLDFDHSVQRAISPPRTRTTTTAPAEIQHSSPPSGADKGKQKAQVPMDSPYSSRPNPSATQYMIPPVPLGQRPRSTQTMTQPTLGSPSADDGDEESDGEIPIRPRPRVSTTQRRPIFDPLDFDIRDEEGGRPLPQPTDQSRLSETVMAGRPEKRPGARADSTDSEMLSDYERTQKRENKKRRVEASPTEKTAVEQEQVIQIDDESIPASESLESYSLSKQYPSPTKTNEQPGSGLEQAPPATGPPAHDPEPLIDGPAASPVIMVQTSTHYMSKGQSSLESNKTGSGHTQSLPTPPPSDDQIEEPPLPTLASRRSLVTQAPDQSLGRHKTHRARVSFSSRHEEEAVQVSSEATAQEGRSRSVAESSRTVTLNREHGVDPRNAGTGLSSDLFTLDMTIDGLSEETIQQYLSKIKAAREKQRSRAL